MPDQTLPNQPASPANPAGLYPTTVKPVFSSAQASPAPIITPSKGTHFKWIFVILIIVLGIITLISLLFRQFMSKGQLSLSKTTLVYWGLWEPQSVMQPIIDSYQKSHPGIQIQYVLQSPQDYRDRLVSSFTQGKGPDIFRFHNTWVSMLQNYLSPLPPSVFDADTFGKTFYPVAQSDLTLNGHIMGVPLEYDGLALFYNVDLFQKHNLPPPKNWNDLRADAIQLTQRDQTTNQITTAGVALGTTNNVDHWQDIFSLMMLQANADLNHPTNNRAIQALQFYTNFVTADHVWNENLPNSTTLFIQGKLAMYLGPSWRVFDFEQARRSQNPSLNYGVLAAPQLPETNVTWASYWAEGVAKNSQNQTAAWDFVKYLSTPAVMQSLYQNESQVRQFGEPYSRQDMANLLQSNPLVLAFLSQAPTAQSWYLASDTNDGSTGLNSRISKYYEDAINTVVSNGTDPQTALTTAAAGVTQVLTDYKISTVPISH